MKIKDNLDEILNSVFTNEEKQILEYEIQTQPPKKMTVQDQFLYYYNKACYDGTKDQLVNAMIIKKQDNMHLIYQLQDLIINLQKIINLDEYNKVTRQYTDTIESAADIRATNSKTQSETNTRDQNTGTERTQNSSLNIDEAGSSQTNTLEEIDSVIKRPTETTADGKTTLTLPDEYKTINYQNFTIEQTLDKTFNNTDTTTQQTTNTTNTSDTLSSSTDTKASKTDESKITVEYLTNDNRVKMWRLEIPQVRRKFWQIFHNIFTYEQW